MAVDTRDKRFSLIGLALPFFRVFPNPDNSNVEDDNERIHYLYLYHGIDPNSTAPPAPSPQNWFHRRRLG